ncbi:MAG: RluA family pseudouridine synthase [Lachnospiraceae bacterium]|nr:RluA family pseudouridine synthase [Lachnospiraceae bacterium]
MKEYVINSADEGQTLLKYLEKVLPGAKGGVVFKALRKKNIVLNGGKATGKEVLKERDSVKVFFSDEVIESFKPRFGKDAAKVSVKKEELKRFKKNIVFEDTNILIVNKDADLLSQSDGSGSISLNDMLLSYLENEVKHYAVKPSVCNRLDRNTSGLVLCGKTQKGLKALSEVIKDRSLKKYYYAIVVGELKGKLELKGYLHKDKEKNMAEITEDKRYEDSDPVETIAEKEGKIRVKNYDLTLLKVQLVTGKPHQIRAHLLHAGYPVLGDMKYFTEDSRACSETLSIKRQMLHAFRVEFPKMDKEFSSISGKSFEAELKDDMKSLLKYRV